MDRGLARGGLFHLHRATGDGQLVGPILMQPTIPPMISTPAPLRTTDRRRSRASASPRRTRPCREYGPRRRPGQSPPPHVGLTHQPKSHMAGMNAISISSEFWWTRNQPFELGMSRAGRRGNAVPHAGTAHDHADHEGLKYRKQDNRRDPHHIAPPTGAGLAPTARIVADPEALRLVAYVRALFLSLRMLALPTSVSTQERLHRVC